MNPVRTKAYIYLLITVIIWGIATLVIKLTLTGIDPLPFLIYRFAISSVIALFFLRQGLKLRFRNNKETAMFIAYAVLGTTFSLGVLFLGLDKTTVLNLSLITLSGPLVAQVAGKLFLKESLTKREKIGTAIAFIGTFLTILQPILASIQGIGTLEGNLLILGYMVGDTASLILLKKLLKVGYSPSTLTHGSFVIGLFTILPISLILMPASLIINEIVSLPLKYHLGVWYMAVLSGTVAYLVRAKGQKSIEVGEAALFGYLTPIVSSVLAVAILGDRLTWIYALGALIILGGVALAETK